jgi:hypothetical protein
VKGIPPDQIPTYIHSVIDGDIKGVRYRSLGNGRVGYWDPATGVIIIEAPGAGDPEFTGPPGTYFSGTEEEFERIK